MIGLKNKHLLIAFVFSLLNYNCAEADFKGNEGTETPDNGIFEEEPDDTSADPQGTFDYSKLANAGHPRLFIDSLGFVKLKEKVTTNKANNEILFKLHDGALDRANNVVLSNPGFESADDHQVIVDNLLSCSYAYKITGNVDYLTKVKSDLEKACNLPDWAPKGLSLGEIPLAVSVAYDWLYYDLSLSERELIHQALVEKGIKPVLNKDMSTTIGNWNSVTLGGATMASLALYEKEKKLSSEQIEQAYKQNKAAITQIYSPDGNYAEGPDYWNYGTSWQVCLLSCLQDIFGHTGGLAETEGFMKSAEFALYFHGTMDTQFSYNDGGALKDNPHITPWWFAAKMKDPSLAFCEKRHLDKGNYSNTKLNDRNGLRLLPAFVAMISDYDFDSQEIVPPTDEIWQGDGHMPVFMVRKGWNFDDTDVFLGVKGGFCNTSHAHMDMGSFIFEAEGVRWSDDIMRPSYGDWFAALRAAGSRSGDWSQKGLRWDTFRINNLCHSTISAYSNDGSVKDKIHPTDYYVDGFASMDRVIDADGEQGVVVNMGGPMKGQVTSAIRTVKLVNGTDLVVEDEITALPGLDCKLEWRMLSISQSTKEENRIVLTKGEKSRYLTTEIESGEPTGFKYMVWGTERPSSWKPRTWDPLIKDRTIVGWTMTVPKGQTVKIVTKLIK